MAQTHDISDFVGCRVSVGVRLQKERPSTEFTGTIYTYDPANAILALMLEPCNQPRPSLKIINTMFVEKLSLLDASPSDPEHRLPDGVAQGVQLPVLSDGNETLQRKVNKTLRDAENKRRYLAGLSIGACQCFDKLSRVHPCVTWSTEIRDITAVASKAPQGTNIELIREVICVDGVIVTDFGGQSGFSWSNPSFISTRATGPEADRIIKMLRGSLEKL